MFFVLANVTENRSALAHNHSEYTNKHTSILDFARHAICCSRPRTPDRLETAHFCTIFKYTHIGLFTCTAKRAGTHNVQ